MHEMSLCESLVRSIAEAAVTHAFTKVRVVRLEIGRFAGVEPDALRFGFDVVARGSVAEGAALEIIDKPGEAWCFDCSHTVEIADRLDPCPRCGGGKLHVTGGDRMIIKDLDVL